MVRSISWGRITNIPCYWRSIITILTKYSISSICPIINNLRCISSIWTRKMVSCRISSSIIPTTRWRIPSSTIISMKFTGSISACCSRSIIHRWNSFLSWSIREGISITVYCSTCVIPRNCMNLGKKEKKRTKKYEYNMLFHKKNWEKIIFYSIITTYFLKKCKKV